MTSERSVNSNKAALRASLKKEDESLAQRIVDTDVNELLAPPPAFTAPVEPPRDENLGRPSQAEEKSSAKTTAKAGRAEAQAAKASKRAKPAASAKRKAEAAKAGAASKTNKTAVAAQEETSPHVNDGKQARGHRSVKTPEKRSVGAKEKREKVVHYSLDLLKSEEVAMESLRSELSKTTGWTASRSDILRAGIRLFAEQTLDRRRDLLTGLTSAAKDKKN